MLDIVSCAISIYSHLGYVWLEGRWKEGGEEKKNPLFGWREIERGNEKWRELFSMGPTIYLSFQIGR